MNFYKHFSAHFCVIKIANRGLLLHLFLLVFVQFAMGQKKPVGIFTHSEDIGKPKNQGSSTYSEATQTYVLKGSGYNIWFNRDEFQYLYKKLSGNFILTANFEFVGKQGNSHRKMGWMIRESADESAASMNAVVHGDGLVVMQWRPLRGAYMRDPEDEIFFPKKAVFQVIQLERRGKEIIMRVANPGEPLQVVGAKELSDMQDSVLAGVYISSHDENLVEEARIWNLRIDKPVEDPYQPNPALARSTVPFRGELGSRLETVDILTGKRMVIHESPRRLQSPNWMPDNSRLLFNQSGSLYAIPVTGGSPQMFRTDSVKGEGNGHTDGRESSPDGKYMYYNANPTGTMQIWRMKPDGSAKEQITTDEHHNWFPHISPDGKWIVFISLPLDIDPDSLPYYKKAMLRIMPVNGIGGARVIAHLYGGQGTLNNNSWSPDSKRLAFVSNSEMIKDQPDGKK